MKSIITLFATNFNIINLDFLELIFHKIKTKFLIYDKTFCYQ